MIKSNLAFSAWQRLSTMPGGKWMFSRLVCWKAPYFASIRPRFEELRPCYCELRIKKRRAVLNHIDTVHAIAMCNMAELAGGTMIDVTVPATHRWLPKAMTVEYLKKAESDLRAVAALAIMPQFEAAAELSVTVNVTDATNQLVFRAVITMWISPRKEKTARQL